MDRRLQDRWPLVTALTVMGLEGEQFGSIYDLEALDCGFGGCGAFSRQRVPVGTLVAVSFQHGGYQPAHGRVTACTDLMDGFRLAIRFERRMAA